MTNNGKRFPILKYGFAIKLQNPEESISDSLICVGICSIELIVSLTSQMMKISQPFFVVMLLPINNVNRFLKILMFVLLYLEKTQRVNLRKNSLQSPTH